MYAKVIEGVADNVVGKPKYFDNDGNSISDVDLISLESIYPVISNLPTIDEYYQYYTSNPIAEWSVNNSDVTETFIISNKLIDDIKKSVLENCSSLRYLYEVGGFIFNTIPIHSNRESQIKIYGSSQAARNGVRIENSKWKTLDNFIEISNSDMIQLGDDTLTFIQECYNREDILTTMINAVDINNYNNAVDAFKSIESTDFKTGWPTNAIYEE